MKASIISLATLATASSAQDTSISTQTVLGTAMVATATATGSAATAMIGTAVGTGYTPASTPVPITGGIAEIGCFSFLGPDFNDQGQTSVYMSYGLCLSQCLARGFPFAALKINECVCGRQVPPNDAHAPHSLCNQPCSGYPMDTCGGDEVYTLITSQSNNGSAPDASSGLASIGLSSAGPNGTGVMPSGTASQLPIPTAGAARFSVGGVAAAVLGSAGFLNML